MMDTTTIAPRAPTTTAFPVAAVETCLRGELIDTIMAEAEIRGETLPDTPAALAKAAVSIDSLVVVSILCAIEPIVGFELPESVVRAGGYRSVEGALGHLMPRIEQLWIKRKEPSYD